MPTDLKTARPPAGRIDIQKLPLRLFTASDYLPINRGSDAHVRWARAARNGGQALTSYYDDALEVSRAVQSVTAYIAQQRDAAFKEDVDGQGNPILIVNPPDGGAVLRINADFFMEPRTDPSTRKIYNGVGEVVINTGGNDVKLSTSFVAVGGTVVITGALVTAALKPILNTLKKVWMALADFWTREPVGEIELSDLAVDLSQSGQQVATSGTQTAVDAGVEVTTSTVEVVGNVLTVAFVVVGVGLILFQEFFKEFRHNLTITNLTDLDLELDQTDLHIQVGKKGTVPATTRLDRVLQAAADPVLYVTQASYVTFSPSPIKFKGIGFVLRFLPNSGMPDGFTGLYDIPFIKKNSVWGSFEETSDDFGAIYDDNRGRHRETTWDVTSADGRYRAILTFNQLDTNDPGGGSYFSTLTLVDIERYGDLLDA